MLETELILHNAGITSNYKGYWLLNNAVDILLENPEAENNIVAAVYKTLAQQFEISPVSVERNISTVISRVWETAPQKLNNSLDRHAVWQPTVSEIILLLTDKVKAQL